MPNLRSHAALLLAATTLAPGCLYYGNQSRDIDRTPIVDTGVGATIIMPGESAPRMPAGSGAGANGSTPSEGAVPGGGGLTMIGGTRVDEISHKKVHEEPVWLKYLTLPFAVVAAPFVAAAEAVKGEPAPGPEVPRVDPPRPQPTARPQGATYDQKMMDGLERELDARGSPAGGTGAADAPLAANKTSAPSIADELAALQRTPIAESARPSGPAANPVQSAPRGAAATPVQSAPSAQTPAETPADGIVDRNEDGRIDLWIYRENGDIVRRVLDEDFDGRPDQTIYYDRATHRVSRVEEDTNHDGIVDSWTDYQEGTLARRRSDANHDGTVDTWTYYRDGQIARHEQDTTGNGFRDRVGFYEGGKLVREEQDTTGSGRPDVIVYYDGDEQITRREEDTDHDGRIDVISHYEKGRLSSRELLDDTAKAPRPEAPPVTP